MTSLWQMIMNLFHRFTKTVYGELLLANDTFRIKLRKICVAIAFVFSFPILIICINDSRSIPEVTLRTMVRNLYGYVCSFVFMGCLRVQETSS